MILWQILLSVLGVSLVSLIGLLTVGLKVDFKKASFYIIGVVSGTMLGGAFLHLIPEALETPNPYTLVSIAGGVFLFFILEKLLIWRHCHTHQEEHDYTAPVAAKMVLMGDAIHNFIDGVIIATAYLINPHVGLSITIAILLHEIPQEMGDFGILLHGGYSIREAIFANLLTATTAIAGALLTYFLGATTLIHAYVLPVAAGGFLYIALADLIPQLHEETAPQRTLQQIVLLATGFGIMFLLKHH